MKGKPTMEQSPSATWRLFPSQKLWAFEEPESQSNFGPKEGKKKSKKQRER